MNQSEREQIRLKELFNDLRYSKQQQWNTVYLTVVLIGGIISFITTKAKDYELGIRLGWVAVVVAVAAVILLINCACDICKYRKDKDTLLEGKTTPCDSWKTVLFTIMFSVIVLFAGGIALYVGFRT